MSHYNSFSHSAQVDCWAQQRKPPDSSHPPTVSHGSAPLVMQPQVVGRDTDGAVGVLPLNLSHCPPKTTPTNSSSSSGSSSSSDKLVPGLTAALSTLLPHVAPLPLSLSALNSTRWYPQQHAATGRLFRGCLQQPEGALLLLDEGELSAGQLGDNGVKNLQVGGCPPPPPSRLPFVQVFPGTAALRGFCCKHPPPFGPSPFSESSHVQPLPAFPSNQQ
jgi:hypothetical protein